ncbi:MAG TPA: hypothetical protein VFP84_05360 [Kofleriaceae bacterium]|nr:hypothetical protein [Kofleriaceae bacterium]
MIKATRSPSPSKSPRTLRPAELRAVQGGQKLATLAPTSNAGGITAGDDWEARA